MNEKTEPYKPGPFYILVSVADNDDFAIQGPWDTQVAAIDKAREFSNQVLDGHEDDLIEDALDDMVPKIIVCNESGVPIEFRIVEPHKTLEECYKSIEP